MTRPAWLIAALVAALASAVAHADQNPATDDVVSLFPYTGILEEDGIAVSDNVEMQLRLYDAATSGTVPLWAETQIVPVHGGRFTVLLGLCDRTPTDAACPVGDEDTVVAIPEVLLFADDLQLEVVLFPASATPLTLQHRKRFLPVPYATWTRAASDLRVGHDLTVNGKVTVAGTVTAGASGPVKGLMLGNVIGSNFYMGIAVEGMNNTNNYALLQASDGAVTLLNAPTHGYVGLRHNNVEKLTASASGVNVLGRLQRDEYQVSCVQGLAGVHFPYCCRINVRDGATACKRTNTTWDTWTTIPAPYGPGGGAGPYSLSCTVWVGGVNYPSCCRANHAGTVECSYNSSSNMDGAWTATTSPW